jgi:hypothetical protein
MYKPKMFYLICKTCKELIDEGTVIVKLRNLQTALVKNNDTAHTNHFMHIIDDDGVLIDESKTNSK